MRERDKKGEYIYVVNRDEKRLEKVYVSGVKEEIVDIDKKKIEKFIKKYDWKTDNDNLGYWKYRGSYSSVDRRKYLSNKGKGKLWRVEDGKLKYFKGKSWFVVEDDWDDNKFGVIGDDGYKWILRGRKKFGLFDFIRRYGVWVIVLFMLFRLLKRIGYWFS